MIQAGGGGQGVSGSKSSRSGGGLRRKGLRTKPRRVALGLSCLAARDLAAVKFMKKWGLDERDRLLCSKRPDQGQHEMR